VATTPAPLTNKGGGPATQPDPTGDTGDRRDEDITPRISHTHPNTSTAPTTSHTVTITHTTPPPTSTLLCPRQSTAGRLTMAQRTTHRTGKRRLAATQSARTDAATGPGIPLHVATQQKQETGVELGVRTTGQKKKKKKAEAKAKSEAEAEARRKRKKGGKRIRTHGTAAPSRPGIQHLP